MSPSTFLCSSSLLIASASLHFSNSGATDDGITSGSETLRLLVEAIYAASGNTVRYEILEIPPINNEDGGAPGGNIVRRSVGVLAEEIFD